MSDVIDAILRSILTFLCSAFAARGIHKYIREGYKKEYGWLFLWSALILIYATSYWYFVA